MAMLSRMHELVEDESQFIIATHSPIIMAYPNAEIFLLSEEGINKTQYTDIEHYQTTKRFINDPERMIDIITY